MTDQRDLFAQDGEAHKIPQRGQYDTSVPATETVDAQLRRAESGLSPRVGMAAPVDRTSIDYCAAVQYRARYGEWPQWGPR